MKTLKYLGFPLLMLVLGLFAGYYWTDQKAKASLAAVNEEFNALKLSTGETIANLNKAIESKTAKIDELNGALDSSATVIANLEGDVTEALGDVEEARKGWAAFSVECQKKLGDLDASWAGAFQLSQQEVAQLKESVKLLDEKTLYQDGIILDQRKIIEDKDRVIAGCEKAKDSISSLYSKERRRGKGKTLVAVLGTIGGFALGRL